MYSSMLIEEDHWEIGKEMNCLKASREYKLVYPIYGYCTETPDMPQDESKDSFQVPNSGKKFSKFFKPSTKDSSYLSMKRM